MTTALDRVADVHARFEQEKQSIVTNRALSDEGRAEALAAATGRANEKITQLRAEQDQQRAAERRRLEQKLLGPPPAPLGATTSDRIAITSSYRDALERAAATDPESDALLDLQRTAQLASDSILERATLTVGMQRGDADVVNGWSTAHPADEADADALYVAMHSSANDLRATLAETLAFTGVS